MKSRKKDTFLNDGLTFKCIIMQINTYLFFMQVYLCIKFIIMQRSLFNCKLYF